jgi:hypothetical protein
LENQTTCLECPDNAVCTNGSNIEVLAGYWRPNSTDVDILECFNPDACPDNSNISCTPGYEGNLCGSCVSYNGTYYYR